MLTPSEAAYYRHVYLHGRPPGMGDFFSDIWHSVTSFTKDVLNVTLDTLKLDPGKAIHDLKAELYDSIKPIAPYLPIIGMAANFIPVIGTVVSAIIAAVNVAYTVIAKGYAKAAVGTLRAKQMQQAKGQVLDAIKTLTDEPQAQAAMAQVMQSGKLPNGVPWNAADAQWLLQVTTAATLEAIDAGLTGDDAAAQATAVAVQAAMQCGWGGKPWPQMPAASAIVTKTIPAVLRQFGMTCAPINIAKYAVPPKNDPATGVPFSGPPSATSPPPPPPPAPTGTPTGTPSGLPIPVDYNPLTNPLPPFGGSGPQSFPPVPAPSYMTPSESVQYGMQPTSGAAVPASELSKTLPLIIGVIALKTLLLS